MRKPDHVTKFLLGLLVIGVWGLLVRSIIQLPNTQAQSKSEKEQSSNTAQVLKARGLIIVDERGVNAFLSVRLCLIQKTALGENPLPA